METESLDTASPARPYGTVLSMLTLLFACRVAGQAVQYFQPQPWLPAFLEFQGSDLPYWALLGAQLVILLLMVRFSTAVAEARLPKSERAGRTLSWIGAMYMGGALLRIGIGLLVPGAKGWFTAWIPAIFHVVLAGWVLTLAAYHVDAASDEADA